MNNVAPRSPAQRFAAIMESVYQALAAQGLRGALTGKLLILVCAKLRRAAARVTLIAAKLQAGTLRLRPPRERAARSRREPPPEPTNPPRLLLPQAFGWLPRMVRAVCFGRSQLNYLLAQPDMVALIAAAPPIAHHLRPICRMLGAKPPPGLFPPRRRRRRKAAVPTTPEVVLAPAKKRNPSRLPAQSAPADPFPSFVLPPYPSRPAPPRKPAAVANGPPRAG